MKESIRRLFESPASVIIAASVLVILSNWPITYALDHSFFAEGGAAHYLWQAASAFVFMHALPAFFIKYIFNRPLSDFGLRMPTDFKQAAKLSAGAILLALPLMIFLSERSDFQEYYAVKQSFGIFLLLSVGLGIIYYLSEEFIFRGFLFFGLWNKLRYHSFWIAGVIFALFHLGKPGIEVVS